MVGLVPCPVPCPGFGARYRTAKAPAAGLETRLCRDEKASFRPRSRRRRSSWLPAAQKRRRQSWPPFAVGWPPSATRIGARNTTALRTTPRSRRPWPGKRSKTDQDGVGLQKAVPHGKRLRPVAALDAWISAARIAEGPLFRTVRAGKVQTTNAFRDHAGKKIL
jgi:hypothetical protein